VSTTRNRFTPDLLVCTAIWNASPLTDPVAGKSTHEPSWNRWTVRIAPSPFGYTPVSWNCSIGPTSTVEAERAISRFADSVGDSDGSSAALSESSGASVTPGSVPAGVFDGVGR